MEQKLFTVQQASQFLGVHVGTIRRWAAQRKLKGSKVGSRGDWRFTKQQLEELKTNGQSDHFTEVKHLLMVEADFIQQRATEHHKQFLGTENFRAEGLDAYTKDHIRIVQEFASHLEVKEILRGTEVFKELGDNIAKNSVRDGLHIEEAVNGIIFLKQAIWELLDDRGVLQKFNIEDFYHISQTIGIYCDVVASKVAFGYHKYYRLQQKELEQKREEFLAIASHELKTPVTSVKAFAQVLQRRFAKRGDAESATLLLKMDMQLSRLDALITDLLDVTRIDAGKLQFREEYFDFNGLVDETIETVQRVSPKHIIYKELTITRMIWGDRDRISQVIINLLTNAIKYSPKAGRVDVYSSIHDGTITLCVKDYGVGITQKDQELIFDRFYRASRPHRETYAGLGLGLYIATQIIQRHNGKIWVESEPTKGSTFCFSLSTHKTHIDGESAGEL